MRYATHLSTTILAGTLLDKTFQFGFGFPYYVGLGIGSLLPDVDHPQSFAGRRSLGLAQIIQKIFGHRGLTHSLIFAAGVTVVSFACLPAKWAAGISLGYIGHLLGDLFSKTGLPLFKPFSKIRIKMPIAYKTGGLSEDIILIISLFALLGLALFY